MQQTGRRDEIMPYRSGYLSQDRRMIEDSLRENRLRAVVATSALELGIDMPDLNYGINLYLPPSRKQFHQRLGRVGRSRPGTFVILAPANQFSEYEDTLEGYYANSVEPSHLYLDNEYNAFQQAHCLKSELKAAGKDTRVPPKHCVWPVGFDAALKDAHGRPPTHLADIGLRSARTSPHRVHSLRDFSEEQLEIIPEGQDHSIGSINFAPAMREAYPGALYRHKGQSLSRRGVAAKRKDEGTLYTGEAHITEPGPHQAGSPPGGLLEPGHGQYRRQPLQGQCRRRSR